MPYERDDIAAFRAWYIAKSKKQIGPALESESKMQAYEHYSQCGYEK